jgi:hypothetical protein
MTEQEWKLKKENAQLKAQLAQVQSQLCQVLFDAAQKEGFELGEAWVDVAGPDDHPDDA